MHTFRMKSEVVCDGIRFGEGPVWCDDGTLVVTSVAEGALYRVGPIRTARPCSPTPAAARTAPRSPPTVRSS